MGDVQPQQDQPPVRGLTVALAADLPADEAAAVAAAIMRLRGVAAVAPTPRDPDAWIERQRAVRALERRVSEVMQRSAAALADAFEGARG